MCPFCLGTVGMVVAGAVSTGGLAALAVKMTRKSRTGEARPSSEERKNKNVEQGE